MKLPAYGRMLLEARRAGKHPERVVVVFGDDWKLTGPYPKLALKPEDYAPRRYDFRCCAGVPVDLVQRSEDETKFLQLAGEVARFAAHVILHLPGEPVMPLTPAHALAFCESLTLRRWPDWWPEEIEKINARNRKQWTEAAIRHLERYLAA